MSVSREVLKWCLGLDLSFQVKNVKRDLSNGFLVAEILSRYYPSEVAMHSFDNSVSLERKRSNWKLLSKLLVKKGIPIDSSMIEQVVTVEGDAAAETLQALYDFIHGPSFEATRAESASSQSSHAEQRQDEAPSTSYAQQMQGYGQMTPMYIPGPEVMGGPGMGGMGGMSQMSAQDQQWVQQQQYMQMLAQMEHMGVAQMGYQPQYGTTDPPPQYQQQQQAVSGQRQQKGVKPLASAPSPPPQAQDQYVQYQQMLMMQQMYQQDGQGGGYEPRGGSQGVAPTSGAGHEGDGQRGGLAFSKKPRPVEYQPYGQREFQEKNYNVKSGQRYWELGTLGPDMETPELQAKREKADKIKQMAAQVKEENARKLAAAAAKPAAVKPPKEPTGREKALLFAKNIPPPPPPPPKPPAPPPVSRTSSKGRATAPPALKSDLEILEEQHDSQYEAVERLRMELMGAMRK